MPEESLDSPEDSRIPHDKKTPCLRRTPHEQGEYFLQKQRLHRRPVFQCLEQRHLVGIFQRAAYRQTKRQTRDLDSQRL